MKEILYFIWTILMTIGFGYIIYAFIRDDIRNERERKAEMLKQ